MATNNAVNTSLAGQTGTGNFVGSNAPSITTSLNDTNGNTWISQTAVSSAVNYINVSDNSTGNPPIISSKGSDTNVPLTLTGQGNSGVSVQGAGTNTSSAAGFLGETTSANKASGSATSISSTTATDTVSISLTAGKWLVFGNVAIIGNGSTISTMYGWLSTTSATLPNLSLVAGTLGLNSQEWITAPPIYVQLASTTNVYLTGYVVFTGGSVVQYGNMFAVRVA